MCIAVGLQQIAFAVVCSIQLQVFIIMSQPLRKCLHPGFSITNVIAILCKKNGITTTSLKSVIECNGAVSQVEIEFANQVQKQLLNKELIVESISTLDVNDSSQLRRMQELFAEPDDDKGDFMLNCGGDSLSEDSDFQLPDEKKMRIWKNDLDFEKMERAYRYWTMQDDYDTPVIIDNVYWKHREKRSIKDVWSQHGRDSLVGQDLRRLRDWGDMVSDGRIG